MIIASAIMISQNVSSTQTALLRSRIRGYSGTLPCESRSALYLKTKNLIKQDRNAILFMKHYSVGRRGRDLLKHTIIW